MTTIALTFPTQTPDAPTLPGTLDAKGFAHATAADFRDFIAAWLRVDPNGTWEPDNIIAEARVMTYTDEASALVFNRDTDAETYCLAGLNLIPA